MTRKTFVPRTPASLGRRRRSKGNAIIESVFTVLPTFALIFAFVDFGMMIFRWSTLQNAVREGVRYAITYQRQTVAGVTLGQDASIKNVVQQYAMNLVKTTDSPQTIYVDYYAPPNLDPSQALPTGGNVYGNVVEVSVKNVSFGWLAPLSGSFGWGIPFFRQTTPLTLSVYSSDVLGSLPVGVSSVPR